jgi:hypothetical protein
MPSPKNAEPAILTTESGIQSLLRRGHSPKSPSGIFVICDGASNVTEDNRSHSQKTPLPRVETEEGKVKEVRMQQLEKALESILRILAGNSNETVINSQHHSKHFSPMTRTRFGTLIENSCQQYEKARAERLWRRELESKTIL